MQSLSRSLIVERFKIAVGKFIYADLALIFRLLCGWDDTQRNVFCRSYLIC